MEGVLGNRGKCAAPCRLPYELIKKDNDIFIYQDKGYLLSPRDLYGLECIPSLINSGISCFKIEGRLKSPEYVATVTRIYKKYIDMALENKEYIVSQQDKKSLLQVFNRGDFSKGHLETEANKKLIYKETPTDTGIYVGSVNNFNSNKGYITLKLNETLSLKDKICIRKKGSNLLVSNYTVSELIKNENNIQNAFPKDIVKIGRIKGNIKSGDKIYKIVSKELLEQAQQTYLSDIELKKIKLEGIITIKKDEPITLNIRSKENGFYKNVAINVLSKTLPTKSIKSPLTHEQVLVQLNKTKNTPFVFERINVKMDEDIYIPNVISTLNDLRRNALKELENTILEKYTRKSNVLYNNVKNNRGLIKKMKDSPSISLLLNILLPEFDYSSLDNIDNLYIPLKYFSNNTYENILNILSNKFNIYIYMPTIVKTNYINLSKITISNAISKYKIKGFVCSNIGNIELLEEYIKDRKYKFIGNYTLNIFNNPTVEVLGSMDLSCITISPELSKFRIDELCNNTDMNKELIVYGCTPIMNCSYCFLGNTNKCYPECKASCKNGKYYLKDRLGLLFRILLDNIQAVSTIYNSKVTSIEYKDYNISSVRIDILDETIEEINKVIEIVKSGKRIQGKDYTNGNLTREV